MANADHVKRLLGGIRAWNEWRKTEPNQRIDLTGANLSNFDLGRRPSLMDRDLHNVNLRGFNLTSANLRGANLQGAFLPGTNFNNAKLNNADFRFANLFQANLIDVDLRGARLGSANLTKAVLHNANLLGADLVHADLPYADLRGAQMRRADLRNANLLGSRLEQAELSGAILGQAVLIRTKLGGARFDGAVLFDTILTNVDLGKTIGLEACVHHGPSAVDFGTFRRSGRLPLAFLRGVGLPDSVIDYLPALLNQPIQYYSCFISYSHNDEDFVQRLHADLQDKGVRCWFAPHDLPIGGKILDEIDAAIRLRDKVVLILSEQSIGSDWVEDEVKTAFEEERKRKQTVLFPIRLDDSIMETKEAWAAKLRADRHIGDFRQWKSHDQYQKTLERVLRDLSTGQKRD